MFSLLLEYFIFYPLFTSSQLFLLRQNCILYFVPLFLYFIDILVFISSCDSFRLELFSSYLSFEIFFSHEGKSAPKFVSSSFVLGDGECSWIKCILFLAVLVCFVSDHGGNVSKHFSGWLCYYSSCVICILILESAPDMQWYLDGESSFSRRRFIFFFESSDAKKISPI